MRDRRLENPWSPWVSQYMPGTFAHPDAPDGGTGAGYSREPGPSGVDSVRLASGAPDPHSLDGLQITPWEAATEYAKFELEQIRESIRLAMSWEPLRTVAFQALGPQSFGLGACYGIVKNPALSVAGLLQLQKMLIQADLYDRLTHRVSWMSRLTSYVAGGMPALIVVAHHLLRGGTHSLYLDDLKRSWELREALIKNLTEMVEHPGDFFGNLSDQLKASYAAKWKRFLELQKQTDLKSQFEAGEIFGDVLMELVMLVLAVLSVAGAAAKLAARVPQLLRVAEFLKTARAAEAGGAAEEAAEEVAEVGKGAGAPARKTPTASDAPISQPPAVAVTEPTTNKSPSKFAESLQGSGDYPGVDRFKDITLKKGTIVYGGTPGQSNFYTTASAIERSGGSSEALFKGLQVSAHPEYGYRPGLTAYRITKDTSAAFGKTLANPQHGPGGLPQIVIEDFQSSLEPINVIPLKP